MGMRRQCAVLGRRELEYGLRRGGRERQPRSDRRRQLRPVLRVEVRGQEASRWELGWLSPRFGRQEHDRPGDEHWLRRKWRAQLRHPDPGCWPGHLHQRVHRAVQWPLLWRLRLRRGCRRRCGRDASGATIGTAGWPRAARATIPMWILGVYSALRSSLTSVGPRPLTMANFLLFERSSWVQAQSPFMFYAAGCDFSLARHKARAFACCGLQMMCTVHRTEFATRPPISCPLCFA